MKIKKLYCEPLISISVLAEFDVICSSADNPDIFGNDSVGGWLW